MPWPVMRELMRRTDGSGLICKGEEQIRPRFEGKKGDRIRLGEKTAFFGLLAEIAKIDKSGRLVAESRLVERWAVLAEYDPTLAVNHLKDQVAA